MEEKIRAILAHVLEIEPGKVGDRFGPDSCSNWDSLSNLRILTALEKEFSIQFTWPEISSMTDFSRIREIIDRHREGK
jgi:acyl carrier protein